MLRGPVSTGRNESGAAFLGKQGGAVCRRASLTGGAGLLALIAWTVGGLAVGAEHSDEKYRQLRMEMVREVVAREGITNEAVLDSMRSVPRHLFVPGNVRHLAYYDQAIAIGHKQTISPPFIVAYMTQVLDPQPTDVVLEIGTGSGYQASILSGIVKDVYTIEIVEALGVQAAKRLADLHYSNVHARVGDGYKGWPEKAPFDKIIVTCSPESVPQPLIDQLREGGRMIIPLGERYKQIFYLFEKKDGKLVKTELLPALFVPMTGISEEQRKILPDPEHPEVRNGGFEKVSGDDQRPDVWHYQRLLTVVHGNAPEGDAYAMFKNTDPGRTAQALQGMALDGKRIAAVRVTLWVKGIQAHSGFEKWEQPRLALHYFDKDRKHIGDAHLDAWEGTFNWQRFGADLPVPPATREAIIQVGLNGGTGTLCVDNITLTPKYR
jgi:protein-L-isoaspartate(D-aspartate) O-methyltransferase